MKYMDVDPEPAPAPQPPTDPELDAAMKEVSANPEQVLKELNGTKE